MSDDSGKKKIIIDEDWKTRVQAEKEVLQEKVQQEVDKPEPPSDQALGPMPPASLPVLLSMLASQAMISLGQIPSPITGKAEVRPDEAKHFIDLIGVIDEKTKGNLSDDESAMLTNLLNELRKAFVSTVSSGPPSPGTSSADPSPKPPAADAS